MGMLLIATLVYVISVASFSVYGYFDAYDKLISLSKNNAKYVLKSFDYIMPSDYHDKVVGEEITIKSFYDDVANKLTSLTFKSDVLRAFSVIKGSNEDIYVTASSYEDEAFDNDKAYKSYFKIFDERQSLFSKLDILNFLVNNNKEIFETVLHKEKDYYLLTCNKKISNGGKIYANCVEFSLNDFEKSLEKVLLRKEIEFVLFLVFLVAFLVSFKMTFFYRETDFKVEMEENTKNLIIALERAKKASVAKSEFLASMSHEIRTPLNAVLGFSEAMMAEVFGPINNEKYREYLKYIHVSSEHLLKLINDILDLTRVEANKATIYEENVDIGVLLDVVKNIISGYNGADKRNIVVKPLDKRFPQLFIDGRMLSQILLNLLSNAVKFTRDGGNIEISAYINEKNGKMNFSVKDDGIGISKENQEKIFDAFEQDETQDILFKKHMGTGLGLSLVRNYVKLFGGDIVLTSEPNKGSEFIVSFPCERVKENDYI